MANIFHSDQGFNKSEDQINHDELVIEKVIGHGTFGCVKSGFWRNAKAD